jgi:hypothetical protein
MNAQNASGDERAEAGELDDLSDFLCFRDYSGRGSRGHFSLL